LAVVEGGAETAKEEEKRLTEAMVAEREGAMEAV
jgi:hypothetical protein